LSVCPSSIGGARVIIYVFLQSGLIFVQVIQT
jgi:hypothetical protein